MADSEDDDVQLTDLEVIQQFSLAVRAPRASRADVIEALEADLAWLRSTAPVHHDAAAEEAFAPPRARSRRRDA